MSVRVSRRSGEIAVAVAAAATILAPAVRAQGGARLYQPVGAAAPAAAPERPRLEPARSLLHRLVGTWRFELWFAGNFAGASDASGTRVLKPLYDDLRLEWTEDLDHSPLAGRGVIGFDPTSGRFFSASVFSAGPAPEVMTGVLDAAEPLITFRAVALAPDSSAAQTPSAGLALNVLDDSHFTLVPQDRAWRAVFTRQPPAAGSP
jgi:uncharacterized protein DUF1579